VKPSVTLIGDHIENLANARTMVHAAAMFGSTCFFHGSPEQRYGVPHGDGLQTITRTELAAAHAPLVACDNTDGAVDVYGFRLPGGPRPALIVGNERRGVSKEVTRLARCAVEIPMVSRRVTTLNVAAAAAVALYYVGRGAGGRTAVHRAPERRRPELLLIGGQDHVELGSTIRSAGAFGWRSLFLEDRGEVWFGSDRGPRTEGRAAARRAKNPIRLVPVGADQRYPFDEAIVVGSLRNGVPISRVRLANGPRQLIVLADEGQVDLDREDWSRLARHVHTAHLDLPADDFVYHYRLTASIALAEIARQIGRAAAPGPGVPRRGLRYDLALTLVPEAEGEVVYLEDLEDY